MTQEALLAEVRDIMIEFADQTGLSTTEIPPRRYLWTDAFAVCNFLTLYRQTGEKDYLHLALTLIDQVHNILGKHRDDDSRRGWISGLSDEEGQKHPTAGGLRIGKTLNERGPDDPYDEQLEWDRDGQYFHYLTKWMHALCRASMVSGDSKYCRWGMELAKAAHAGFSTRPLPDGKKRLYWKMSIDLSYPLLHSMGLHDPLDGFITYHELCLCAQRFEGVLTAPDLREEIADTANMCDGQSWETNDPLGIGGLLCDACRVFQMVVEGHITVSGLLEALLVASRYGLDSFLSQSTLNHPADYRLAFRELGLSIGLRAVPKMRAILNLNPAPFKNDMSQDLESLMTYISLGETIENFWRDPVNQRVKSWQGHRDINMVMLATSLAPEEFLAV